MTEAWQEHGAGILQILAREGPAKFTALAFGFLPRDILDSVEQRAPSGLSVGDWATVLRVLGDFRVHVGRSDAADVV